MGVPLGLKGAIIIIQNNNKSNYSKWPSSQTLVNLICNLGKLFTLCLSVFSGKMA